MENVEEADFVLAHGTEALGLPSGSVHPMNLEGLEKILEHCATKKIPMVVANPDFVTVEARALSIMPGKDLLNYRSGLKDNNNNFRSHLCCTTRIIKQFIHN